MGAKIDIFLNSFNDTLLKAIDTNADKRANFDRVRADAIKISINRSGSWPNNTSIKTIGDLFGFVFPAEGGIKNEPEVSFGAGSLNPEYLTYLDDINSEKKIYNELNKLYRGLNLAKRLFTLKEKGGAQFWFDYFMNLAYSHFLKKDSFLKKIKDSSEYSQLLPNGGSSVSEYKTFDLFDEVIFSDGGINDYTGLHKFLTNNLSTDELLYDAFIEAGDNYEGPYTKDIKDPVNFFNLLDGNVPEIVPEVITASASTPEATPEVTPVVETPSTIAATPSAKISLVVNDIPEGFTIQAKTDMPLFSIYVGDQTKKVYDDYNDLPELDSEYIEEDFKGAEESVVNLDDAFVSFPESTESYVDSSKASLDDPFIEKSMAKISDASKKETESDKQLTLIRESTGDSGVKGTMYFNGKIVATTLERPYDPPQDKNQNEKCITAGTYKLSFEKSGKSFLQKHYVKFPESDKASYKTGVITAINGVPSQQGIRIHGGGSMMDSLGCVLVSDKRKSNGDLVYNISIAQYITKLINLKNIKNIKIINEFLS